MKGAQGYGCYMSRHVDDDRFPEWRPFLDAVETRRPDDSTWCDPWTVRDIVVHQTGTAEELARVLSAHLDGEPVGTRSFEEREALRIFGYEVPEPVDRHMRAAS